MAPKRASQEQEERKPQEEQEEQQAPIYPLAVTSVVENEDGSVEVNSRGRTVHLEGEDAEAFKLQTSSAYRAQQEQPAPEMTALQLVRKMGALR